ncbi:MAG: hypothetical protein K6T87_10275 [Roseiflexus sp.]|uniref:hypothetical protein n=1 Tax=Roseiflexus sp. TaxID=2562120 RepID=UPI0025D68872|nr:hypothetical protein [Roseiflexus sp.]MCL6540947.1 hypothetical protein [Roseiflexus sp.]
MTLAELLSFLGLAWSRLLIFPGGLCAFVIVWLIRTIEHRRAPSIAAPGCTGAATLRGMGTATLRGMGAAALRALPGPSPLAASAVVLPWLGVALLPLPLAAPLSRPVDLVVIMALLEWPRLLAISVDLHTGERLRGMQRLAAALNSYPPLALALILTAEGTGTLESMGLLRIPEGTSALWWFWIGVGALILTLPPLIEAGPFALDAPDDLRFGMRLRALGIVLITALPGIALLTRGGDEDWWRIALPPLALTGAIWLVHRSTRHHSAQRWAHVYLILDVLLTLALLAAGLLALRERLVV